MSDSDQDTYLWLEDVASSESLDWARKRNLENEQSLVEDPLSPRSKTDCSAPWTPTSALP